MVQEVKLFGQEVLNLFVLEFLKSVCFAKNFFNLAQETVKRREVER